MNACKTIGRWSWLLLCFCFSCAGGRYAVQKNWKCETSVDSTRWISMILYNDSLNLIFGRMGSKEWTLMDTLGRLEKKCLKKAGYSKTSDTIWFATKSDLSLSWGFDENRTIVLTRKTFVRPKQPGLSSSLRARMPAYQQDGLSQVFRPSTGPPVPGDVLQRPLGIVKGRFVLEFYYPTRDGFLCFIHIFPAPPQRHFYTDPDHYGSMSIRMSTKYMLTTSMINSLQWLK